MNDYPTCTRCGHSILMHRLFGHLAYCDPEVRNKETRAPFTVAEVNAVQRALGWPVSDQARDLELREA